MYSRLDENEARLRKLKREENSENEKRKQGNGIIVQ